MNRRRKASGARALGIAVVIVVMAAVVWNMGESWRERSHEGEGGPYRGVDPLPAILKKKPDVSTPAVAPSAKVRPGTAARELKKSYALRAYSGAPPVIPHEVDTDMVNRQQCGTCHEKGGFVPPFQAYAPITPHPEYVNCTQCHVPKGEEGLFRASEWASVSAPPLHRPALPGSPPPIPHTLQLRDNCQACHAGPSAPVEIRTSHPERLNCVQCHAPQHFEIDEPYSRNVLAGAAGDGFERQESAEN